jgi:hypothetical protein
MGFAEQFLDFDQQFLYHLASLFSSLIVLRLVIAPDFDYQ